MWGGEGHVVNACRVSHTEGSPLGMEGPGRRRAQNGRRGCLGLFVPALHKWNRYEMKRQGLLVPGTIRAGSLWLSCTDHFEINRFGLGFFWAILRTSTNRIGSDCVCLPIDYILLFLSTYKYTSNLPRIPPNASEMRSHTEVLGKSQPHGQVHVNQPLKGLGDDAVRPKGKVAQLGPKAVEHQAETPAWAAQQFVSRRTS